MKDACQHPENFGATIGISPRSCPLSLNATDQTESIWIYILPPLNLKQASPGNDEMFQKADRMSSSERVRRKRDILNLGFDAQACWLTSGSMENDAKKTMQLRQKSFLLSKK
jgi:hypothetical protein